MNAEYVVHDPGKTQSRLSLTVVPTPVRHSTRLESIQDVRREMARVYRAMKRGRIDTHDGTRMTYVLGQIGKLIQTTELEQRIAALERATKQRIA